YITTGLAQLFVIRREQGRLDEVEPIASSALDIGPGLIGFKVALALARLELDKPDGVHEEIAQLADQNFRLVPRDLTWPVSLCLFAELSNRLGDAALARATYDALSAILRR